MNNNKKNNKLYGVSPALGGPLFWMVQYKQTKYIEF